MDSTCYTIMYTYNSGMYYEPRHDIYDTGNTVIVHVELNCTMYINGTLETFEIYVAKYQ